MRRAVLTRALLALTALAAALAGCERTPASKPAQAARQNAIQIDAMWAARLPDLDGREQALAQWRGEVLVLNFWAPWCAPCREEIPVFIRLQARHGERGLRFVGIALDEPARVAEFVHQHAINYPTLLGGSAAAALARAAGNRQGGLPYTLILDRAGNPVAGVSGKLSEARLEALVLPLL